ncbi:MAG: radical SAM family heme chaperone HemW [Bacteroidales bacterium]
MSGIYIHIPFCKTKCPYCDFCSSTREFSFSSYVEALKTEINLRYDYIDGKISTIYFGGGTPSLLNADMIHEILELIHEKFKVEKKPEITIECNPDDLTNSYLERLKKAGINRISLGTQSFNDEELRFLGRRHTAKVNHTALERIFASGFENVSIDLMYGLPGSSLKSLKYSIDSVLKYPVNHISAYHLTFEENTHFYSLLKAGILDEITEELSREQYQLLVENLNSNGFEQYEISNFAKGENYSIHNTNYWRGLPYLGIGVSAHSFNGIEREWNIADVDKYMKALKKSEYFSDKEILSRDERYNEYIMTGLRTKWGVSKEKIIKNYSEDRWKYFWSRIGKYLDSGDMIEKNGNYLLSRKGFFISDHIMADLMVVD